MDHQEFQTLIAGLTAEIADHSLEAGLTAHLNARHGPGSAHQPAVSSGRALVLYLLPQGAIEFTQAA